MVYTIDSTNCNVYIQVYKGAIVSKDQSLSPGYIYTQLDHFVDTEFEKIFENLVTKVNDSCIYNLNGLDCKKTKFSDFKFNIERVNDSDNFTFSVSGDYYFVFAVTPYGIHQSGAFANVPFFSDIPYHRSITRSVQDSPIVNSMNIVSPEEGAIVIKDPSTEYCGYGAVIYISFVNSNSEVVRKTIPIGNIGSYKFSHVYDLLRTEINDNVTRRVELIDYSSKIYVFRFTGITQLVCTKQLGTFFGLLECNDTKLEPRNAIKSQMIAQDYEGIKDNAINYTANKYALESTLLNNAVDFIFIKGYSCNICKLNDTIPYNLLTLMNPSLNNNKDINYVESKLENITVNINSINAISFFYLVENIIGTHYNQYWTNTTRDNIGITGSYLASRLECTNDNSDPRSPFEYCLNKVSETQSYITIKFVDNSIYDLFLD